MKKFWAFITGRKECWECGGTGQSPRGYGDSSPCGTCNETGWIKTENWFHKHWPLFLLAGGFIGDIIRTGHI